MFLILGQTWLTNSVIALRHS